jgi:hypothetical protein
MNAEKALKGNNRMTEDKQQEKAPEPRRENPIFTIWVHTGYAVLILSMIAWMVYMEFFM